MISFRQLFKEVNCEKWSLAVIMFSVILLWDGLDYLAYFLNFHFLNIGNLDIAGLDSGFKGVFLFFLLSQQERVWRLNRYRLLPVSESRLYAANLLGTMAIFILMTALEVADGGLRMLILHKVTFEFDLAPGLAFAVVLLVYAGMLLLIPTTISFINLSSRALITSFPRRISPGLSKVVIILVVLATQLGLGIFAAAVLWMLPMDDLMVQFGWILALLAVVTVAIFVGLTISNLALLKKAIETRK